MKRNDILVVMPYGAWFASALKEAGFQVVCPYHGNVFFLRLIREFCFRLKLPLKTIWYKGIDETYRYFFISASLITSDYIAWLKKNHPNVKIILFYINKVDEKKYNPFNIPETLCEKWTSDKDDAKKYHMHLYEGGGYFRQWRVNKTTPAYDVFYIGKDKNRLARLRKIEGEMNNHGIKTLFYITWERSWQKKDDGIHQPFLPYEGVLDYIGKSKAILHLLEGAQNGITIRIQESLIHKVKLITDDVNIVKYDFYNPNNIFILGRDDMNGLKEFLDAPYEDVKSDFFKHAYYDQMIDEIVMGSYRNSTFGMEN